MAVDLTNDSFFQRNRQFIDEIPSERESISIDGRDSNAYDITIQQKYEAKEKSSGALNESEYPQPTEVDYENAKRRVSKFSDRIGIFLYNLLPYQAVNAISGLGTLVVDPKISSLLTSTAMNSLSGLQKLKYFTPAELALTMGHNFYTLYFLRGITAKKGKTGNSGIASEYDIWSGEIDIFFGRNAVPNFSVENAARKLFSGIQNISESGNAKLQEIKDSEGRGISPKITIQPNFVSVVRKENFQDQLSSTNEKKYYRDFDVAKTILRDQTKDAQDNRWQRSTRQLETEEFSYDEIKNRDHEKNQEEYLINENVLKVSQTNRDGEEDSFEFNDVLNRTRETNIEEYLINDNVLKIAMRVQEVAGLKWSSLLQDEDFDYDEVRTREGEKNIDNLIVNNNVLNIRFKTSPLEEEINEGSPQEFLRRKEYVRNGEAWQIGAIYVIPVISSVLGRDIKRFYIPFEFNPEINENSVGARYQQTEVLSRIGQIQSYTGTNSLSINLSASYHAVSHEDFKDQVDQNGHGWMTEFTLRKIQAIELAYRSLVYPHFPDEESVNQGYKYVKPPLIKVVMGDYENTNAPYANLLTYQTDLVVQNKLDLGNRYGENRLRTFIATEVSIKKDLKETPLYLDEGSKAVRDTFGFDVSLSLTEVTANYMDMLPDFKNRFDQYNFIMSGSELNLIER